MSVICSNLPVKIFHRNTELYKRRLCVMKYLIHVHSRLKRSGLITGTASMSVVKNSCMPGSTGNAWPADGPTEQCQGST